MTPGTEDLVEALRNALLENERLRRRNKQLLASRSEPIAVVGMGCRFPGGVNAPDQLWELLSDGSDAISSVPSDRGWTASEWFPDVADMMTSGNAIQGGFLSDAGAFDPDFFGVSPQEALAMDPQQRLLLEISWEALERAGIRPADLRGKRTGVFIGAGFSAYAILAAADSQDNDSQDNAFSGNANSMISGRVSYALGLEGPALTVDTACSSGLVALHLACQALRGGECTLALAGGAAVMAIPSRFAESARQGLLAADGRCKPFGAELSGVGWGEGAGVLAVERLSDARRNGHPVLAVIRGSAVNQAGASGAESVPSDASLQRVIRAALAGARLSPAEVDAVEAHGNSTVLADCVEARAVIVSYGQDRPPERPLWLGSVKSNIGHTQAASGVAGVMKMVLALQHQVLPRTLHADQPLPQVDWSAGHVRLLTEPVRWPAAPERVRRAGITTFGMSGTNAHVILEEAPAATDADVADGGAGGLPGTEAGPVTGARLPVLSGGPTAWLVSGRGEEGLRAQAGRLAAWAAGPGAGAAPGDVAWSLATTRSLFEHRAVVIGADAGELTAGLTALAAGRPAPGVVSGVYRGGPVRAGFLFTGHGTPRPGTAAGLYAASPVFAAVFDETCGLLERLLEMPVAEVALGGRGRAAKPGPAEAAQAAQAGLFAVQVSLAAVLGACGITPVAVAGYSLGEVAAAHAAGVLSLADACALAAGAVRLTRDEMSGTALAEFDQLVAGLAHGKSRVPWAVPLRETAAGERGPQYWSARARYPAEPIGALEALAASEVGICFEIGPGDTLTGLEPLAAACQDAVFVPLQRDGTDLAGSVLAALALAHVSGTDVHWKAVLGSARRVELPTYAFRRQRYWAGVPVLSGGQP